jgi:hypothetical protein
MVTRESESDGTDTNGTPRFDLIVAIGAIAIALLRWRKKRII